MIDIIINMTNGDSGKSSLIGKSGISKTSPIFDLLGDLDELNSSLGLAKSFADTNREKKTISEIQKDIISVSSLIADGKIKRGGIDNMMAKLSMLIFAFGNNDIKIKKFISPGKSTKEATIHLSRAICRRAERSAWKLAGKMSIVKGVAIYLNHLSKFLFIFSQI